MFLIKPVVSLGGRVNGVILLCGSLLLSHLFPRWRKGEGFLRRLWTYSFRRKGQAKEKALPLDSNREKKCKV